MSQRNPNFTSTLNMRTSTATTTSRNSPNMTTDSDSNSKKSRPVSCTIAQLPLSTNQRFNKPLTRTSMNGNPTSSPPPSQKRRISIGNKLKSIFGHQNQSVSGNSNNNGNNSYSQLQNGQLANNEPVTNQSRPIDYDSRPMPVPSLQVLEENERESVAEKNSRVDQRSSLATTSNNSSLSPKPSSLSFFSSPSSSLSSSASSYSSLQNSHSTPSSTATLLPTAAETSNSNLQNENNNSSVTTSNQLTPSSTASTIIKQRANILVAAAAKNGKSSSPSLTTNSVNVSGRFPQLPRSRAGSAAGSAAGSISVSPHTTDRKTGTQSSIVTPSSPNTASSLVTDKYNHMNIHPSLTTSSSTTKIPETLATPGSIAANHASACLLIQANWAIFPKHIAQQLKASRFVLLDNGEETSHGSSENQENLNGPGNGSQNGSARLSLPAYLGHLSAPNSGVETTLNGINTFNNLNSLNGNSATSSSSQLGHHLHSLRSTRRLEKLGGMLRELMGTGKKVRDDALSALPELGLDPFSQKPQNDGQTAQKQETFQNQNQPQLSKKEEKRNSQEEAKNNIKGNLSLMSSLIAQIERGERDINSVVNGVSPACRVGPTSTSNTNSTNAPSPPPPIPQSLLQKYGKCHEVVGKGTYGIVRVAHKFDKTLNRDTLFAVKEFRRRSQESESRFHKRLASEYCISSSLHDNNIIHTLDLMKDGRGGYCQVMEYCDGGDLYSLILASEGGLKQAEADCFFKQLVRGVVYMHSMGVAHCDLKPENLLLTCNGSLKISDFGNAECFQMAWETEVNLLSGVCGSRPYIAPEQFKDAEFDPRAVDVWACGVIYMVMRTGSYLWQVANVEEDALFEKYLVGRKQKNGFAPIEALRRAKCRNVIYSILDPIPSRRITGKQILNSEWGRTTQICKAGERGY